MNDLRATASFETRPAAPVIRRWLRDPRNLQIAVLSSLLAYGVLALDFEVRGRDAAIIVATALATQLAFCSRISRVPFDPRSPLISALSLALLLRSAEPGFLVVAAVIAIASKFIIRVGDKHVFNPTNLAIVVMVFGSESAWISPGQWGSELIGASALVLLGSLILNRARRSDITFAFLGFWSALLISRSLWLGEPMEIPIHRLQSGGLLLFAFFMLSDPRTIPDSRRGRVLHALLIAAVAGVIEFVLYRPHGLLLALVGCAPLVPLFDRWLPGRRFAWPGLATALERPSPIHTLESSALRVALLGESECPTDSTRRSTS